MVVFKWFFFSFRVGFEVVGKEEEGRGIKGRFAFL